MLELDKIGADWDLARNHGAACKPGRPIKNVTSLTSIANIDS